MKRRKAEFRTVETGGRETWFAGANTEKGFVSSYGAIADEEKLERLYVIKGGPGTGKSTLMRMAAQEAENRGIPAVRYLCGSDPDSLDAVVIGGRIALADGTAPHVLEMEFPGAASSLLDLSRFWRPEVLERERGTIIRLSRRKSEAYGEAYRCLRAAGEMEKAARAAASACFLRDKAAGAVGRLVKKLGAEGSISKSGGERTRRYTHAVTMKGLRKVDTVRDHALRRFVVEDGMGCAALFMPLLSDALTEYGAAPVEGLMPVGDGIAGIRAGDCSFTVGQHAEEGIPIRMQRFFDPERAERGKLRLTEKLRDSCLNGAADCLREAAAHHFALEEIYRSAMDYDRMAEYRTAVIGEIMERLK
jgi:hypothetical protein